MAKEPSSTLVRRPRFTLDASVVIFELCLTAKNHQKELLIGRVSEFLG